MTKAHKRKILKGKHFRYNKWTFYFVSQTKDAQGTPTYVCYNVTDKLEERFSFSEDDDSYQLCIDIYDELEDILDDKQ